MCIEEVPLQLITEVGQCWMNEPKVLKFVPIL
jgi:hypothetical protein